MYPLADQPVHEALPVGGLTKLCRVNDWAPSLNPYNWSFTVQQYLNNRHIEDSSNE